MAAYKIYSKTNFDLTHNNNAILQLIGVSHIEYSQEHNIARCLGILGKIEHSCNLSKKKDNMIMYKQIQFRFQCILMKKAVVRYKQ